MDVDVIPSNEQLLAARKSRSFTCQEVASALNLPLRAIENLEQGNFDSLSGEAFVTGYMRAYAELMDFSAERTDLLIAQYLESSRAAQSLAYKEPEMFNSRLSGYFQHKQHKTGYGLAIAMMLVIGLGFISIKSSPPVLENTADNLHVQTAAGTTVISSIQSLPSHEPTKGLLAIVSAPQEASSDSVEHILKQRLQGNVGSELVLSDSNLSFQFTADCWVEIKDGNDKVIFSSLQKAAETLELTGKPPFRITLGYAPGVELSYNGQPVRLDAKSTDLMKLVVGNS